MACQCPWSEIGGSRVEGVILPSLFCSLPRLHAHVHNLQAIWCLGQPSGWTGDVACLEEDARHLGRGGPRGTGLREEAPSVEVGGTIIVLSVLLWYWVWGWCGWATCIIYVVICSGFLLCVSLHVLRYSTVTSRYKQWDRKCVLMGSTYYVYR